MLNLVRIGQFTVIALLALNFALAACGRSPTPAPPPTSKPTEAPTMPPTAQPTETPTPAVPPGAEIGGSPTVTPDYPPAVLAAINALSTQRNIPADQIVVVNYEAVDWNNACLGLAGSGEMCAEVITPGYRIVLRGGGGEFEFHTNGDGTAIRQK